MRVATSIGLALSASVLTFALGSQAHATSVRTFVASFGSDANTGTNCPRTSPCRNLSAAFGVTTAGGEIVALDSAGYGTLTINKAVTIVGVDGAFIAVPASGTGISISAGASDLVVLRNIQITGSGASSTTGISLSSGKLHVENCSIRALTVGLFVGNSHSTVVNSNFVGNLTAVATSGTGVDTQAFPPTGTTWVAIFGGAFTYNSVVFSMSNPGLRPSPATDNRQTILVSSQSSSPPILIAGNTTTIAGSGTGCGGSNCLNFATVNTQTGNVNLN